MNILTSPLEQFEVNPLLCLYFFGFDFSITNSSLYLILSSTVCLLFFYLALSPSQNIIPTRWQFIAEQVYTFILDMVKQQAGYKALAYMPALLTMFTFIVFNNSLGLTLSGLPLPAIL